MPIFFGAIGILKIPCRDWSSTWGVSPLKWAPHGLQDLQWHDARDSSFSDVDFEVCWALVLNVAAGALWSRVLGSRHWVGLRRFGGIW